MGGTVGKGIKSRVFKDYKTDRNLAIGFKDVQFIHKATLGDTGLDLTNLTLPTDVGGFINPTPSEISAIGSTNLRTKLSIYEGSGSKLAYGLSYEIVGTRIIFKNFTALSGEIFYGSIRDIKRTGASFLDGKQNIVTGFLEPGQTDFNVGFAFKVNHNSNYRVGSVSVKRQRQQAYRNSGNSSTVTDGDFYEVAAGNSQYSTVIRFNEPGTTLPGGLFELIEVKNNDLFVDKENDSLRSEMETQQGTVLRMAGLLSDIQNIPLSEIIDTNPNMIQLKQFGDYVMGLLQRIEDLENTKVLWQRKDYSSNITDLNFNNLEAGKFYKITVHTEVTCSVTQDYRVQVTDPDGSTNVFGSSHSIGWSQTLAGGEIGSPANGSSCIFEAQASGTLTFSTLVATGTLNRAFAILEELPFHEVTTKWT